MTCAFCVTFGICCICAGLSMILLGYCAWRIEGGCGGDRQAERETYRHA